MTLVPAGPDYCLTHHGIREEDEHECDFLDPDNPDHTCDTCEGVGEVREVAIDMLIKCPDCDFGLTRCDLTPLLYENGKPA